MGKKGNWLSAIKRLLTFNSNPLNEAHKKSKNKGKGRGRFKHGSSFFPLCREPSSIEQILGEIDQHNLFTPTTQPQQPQLQPQPQPPQPQLPQPQQPQPQPQLPQPQQPQPQPQLPQPQQPQPQPQPRSQPQPQQPQSQPQPQLPQSQPQKQPQPSSLSSGRLVSPPQQRLTSPPRITSPPTVAHQQPKISHRPEPTLQQRHLSATRIQAVYRGYMARRRNAGGIQRLQRVVTSRSVKRQTVNAMKQMQLLVRVQSQIQSRRIQMLQNQAVKPQPNQNISHKQPIERWDDTLITKEERDARLQRKADAAIKRERAMAYAHSHQIRKDTPTSAHKLGGYHWWWKWVEHQLPYHTTPTPKNHQFPTTPSSSSSRSIHKQPDTPTTPMSSRSANRWIKPRKGTSLYSMKDDDSLRSCPPFSVPNYMSPTASARAKARPRTASNPKERCVTPTTPCSESSKRRFSSPFTPNSNRSPGSIGDVSMDSSVGRKPFNRFV